MKIVREHWQDSIQIENAQYFRLEIALRDDISMPLVIQQAKFYLSYTGNDVRFTGTNVEKPGYQSLDLPFGFFYKTQIAPFVIRTI